MVNFVATTRRWQDRGNPRDARDATLAKAHFIKKGSYGNIASLLFFYKDRTRKKPPLCKGRWAAAGGSEGWITVAGPL